MEPEELRKQVKKGAVIAAFFLLAAAFYALGWTWALVAYALIVAVLAVLAILLQSGRGGGLAASLGGLGGDSLLGTHSATPIAKATYVMLGLFLFVCVLVARLGAPASRRPAPLPPRALPIGAPAAPAPGAAPIGAPAAPIPESTGTAQTSAPGEGAPPAAEQPPTP